MNKTKCKHEYKTYSPNTVMLASYPPKTCYHWICNDCGYEGTDVIEENTFNSITMKQLDLYNNIKDKFKKKNG